MFRNYRDCLPYRRPFIPSLPILVSPLYLFVGVLAMKYRIIYKDDHDKVITRMYYARDMKNAVTVLARRAQIGETGYIERI